MALTVDAGDPKATLMTGAGVFTSDQKGLVSGLVRGTTDTDITAIVLLDETGTIAYTYPAAGGASSTTSTTRP